MRVVKTHFMRMALVLLVAAAAAPATAQTYTDLHNFNSNGGPNDPFFNVIAQGRDGNVYGTSEQGFTGGLGDVYKITPEGTVTELHQFSGLSQGMVFSGDGFACARKRQSTEKL